MLSPRHWFRVSALCAASSVCVLSGAGQERAWHQEQGFRWAPLEPVAGGRTGFTLLPPELTGLIFTNRLDEWKGESNRVLSNGSGVTAGDFDGDGRPDLFF